MDCIVDCRNYRMVMLVQHMLVTRRIERIFRWHSFLYVLTSLFYYPKAFLNFSIIGTRSTRLPENPLDSKNCSMSLNSFSENDNPSLDNAEINILWGVLPLFVNL